jgi:hypothetical protein
LEAYIAGSAKWKISLAASSKSTKLKLSRPQLASSLGKVKNAFAPWPGVVGRTG